MRIEGRNISDPDFGHTNIRNERGQFGTSSQANQLAGTIRAASGQGFSVSTNAPRISRMSSAVANNLGNNTMQIQKLLDESSKETRDEFKNLTSMLAKNMNATGKAQLKAVREIGAQIQKLKMTAGDKGDELDRALGASSALDESRGGGFTNSILRAFRADEGQGLFQGIAQSFKEPDRFFGTKGLASGFAAGKEKRLAVADAESSLKADALEQAAVAIANEKEGSDIDVERNQLLKDIRDGKSQAKATAGGQKEKGSGLDIENELDVERNKLLEKIAEQQEEMSGNLGSGGGLMTGLIGGLGGLLTAKLIPGIGSAMRAAVMTPFKMLSSGLGKLGKFLGIGADVAGEAGEAAARTIAREGAEEVAEATARTVAREGTEEVVEGTARATANTVARQTAGEIGEAGAREATETIALTAAKKPPVPESAILKALGKKATGLGLKQVPLLGAAAGGVFALGRLLQGDFAGAAAEAGGIFLPSVAGAPLDIGLMARDVYNAVYGTEDDPFPHDRDALTPESGYGENYGQIVDVVKNFFTGQNDALGEEPEIGTATADGSPLEVAETAPAGAGRRARRNRGPSTEPATALADMGGSVDASTVSAPLVPTGSAVENVTVLAAAGGGGGPAPVINNVTNNNNNSSSSSSTQVFNQPIRNSGSSLQRYNDKVFMG